MSFKESWLSIIPISETIVKELVALCNYLNILVFLMMNTNLNISAELIGRFLGENLKHVLNTSFG